VEILFENKEMQSTMIEKVPSIARSIQEDRVPWQVIGSISSVEVLVENKEIRKAIRKRGLYGEFYGS